MSFTDVLAWGKSRLRERLTSSLYNYMSDGLGFELFAQPHESMCAFGEAVMPPPPKEALTAVQRRYLYVAPRETLKSSTLVQAAAQYYAVKYKLIYNYDARIAIVRYNREHAETMLGAIRDNFEKNPVIREAFGSLEKGSSNWTGEALTLGWRSTAYREPTFMAVGMGFPLTSFHFDVILVDDLVNETNYDSPREMSKVWNYVQSLYPVLNAWGSIICIGTPWSNIDYISRLIKREAERKEKGEKQYFIKSVNGAYLPDGNLFYPGFLTEERLSEKRETLDNKLFTSQYLCKIVSDEARIFKPEYMQYYEGQYTPGDYDVPAALQVTSCSQPELVGNEFPVRCTVYLDTATAESSNANSTGIIVRLIDRRENWYIHEAQKHRETYSKTIKRVGDIVQQYEPDHLSIEVVSANELWVPLLEEEFRRRKVRCNIIRYHPKGEGKGLQSKSRRIGSLEYFFEKRKVFIRRGLTKFIDECDTYDGPSRAEHFDLLDALAQGRKDTTLPHTAAELAAYIARVQDAEEDEDGMIETVRATYAGYGAPDRIDENQGSRIWENFTTRR